MRGRAWRCRYNDRVDVDAEIQRLTARRAAIWAGAESTVGEVERIGKKLSDLYERKRHDAVADRTARPEILRRSRVESELERLMTRRKA